MRLELPRDESEEALTWDSRDCLCLWLSRKQSMNLKSLNCIPFPKMSILEMRTLPKEILKEALPGNCLLLLTACCLGAGSLRASTGFQSKAAGIDLLWRLGMSAEMAYVPGLQ